MHLPGQGILITDDATTLPDNSAILELKSTSKGFLPTRLTQTQIDGLADPKQGMLVFNITERIPVIFNGTVWVDLTGSPVETGLQIGDYHQGGIIFYLDGLGGGYISGTEDLDVGGDYTHFWGCLGTTTNATSTTNGAVNSDSILANCSTPEIAADLCGDYESDGYSDWFLPSTVQLDSMYVHRNEIGGFVPGSDYQSSTETNSSQMYIQNFSTGVISAFGLKEFSEYRVRPMRIF